MQSSIPAPSSPRGGTDTSHDTAAAADSSPLAPPADINTADQRRRTRRRRRRPRILTVGDGDLTFSLALIRAFGTHQLDLTASVLLDSEDELRGTYANVADASKELRDSGVEVRFGIDAARLDDCLGFGHGGEAAADTATNSDASHADAFWTCAACRMPRNTKDRSTCVKCWAPRGTTEKVRGRTYPGSTGGNNALVSKSAAAEPPPPPPDQPPHRYDLIMFNHPHLGTSTLAESESHHALRHHALLSHYLRSASRCLTDRGMVHLCLCGSQPKTWDVFGAASRNGLELAHECGTAGPVHDWLLRGFVSSSFAGGENDVEEEGEGEGGCGRRRRQELSPPSSSQKGRAEEVEKGQTEEPTELTPLPVQPGHPAPRRYRNGRLGSRHYLGRYGYRHRRTGGDQVSGGNEGADVTVEGSVNLLFRRRRSGSAAPSLSPPSCPSLSSLSLRPAVGAISARAGDAPPSDDGRCCSCPVCGVEFVTDEDLRSHLAAPALPDAMPVSSYRDEETGREFPTLYALRTYQRQRREDGQREEEGRKDEGGKRQRIGTVSSAVAGQGIDENKAGGGGINQKLLVNRSGAVKEQARVAHQFDGKRLRWYCRQPSVFASVKSKKQCEDMIKAGRVHVNGTAAFDSGRIVRSGDSVSIVAAASVDVSYAAGDGRATIANAGSNAEVRPEGPGPNQVKDFGVKIVKVIDPDIAIAYKPVGMRSAGTFSSQTLEMVVPTLLRNGRKCSSLTKLETGCAGLCVLATPSGDSPLVAESTKQDTCITYIFTALVHGHAPVEWSKGVYINIPHNCSRRWKRNSAGAKDEGNDARASTDNTGGAPTVSAQNDPSTQQLQQLFVQCTERTTICEENEATPVQVSTVEITSTAESGRLCNTICYLLRKHNYAVVNDRFCKREFAALPRLIRNHLKNKLCIGCYRVELKRNSCTESKCEPDGMKQHYAWEVVETSVPDRLSSSWWGKK